MTKLKPEDVLKRLSGLKDILKGKYPRFDQYTFPEEFTAESIANYFKVTKATALVRLRGMEEDGLLASRKTYVEGKPGKNFVFMLKEDAVSGSGGALDGAARTVGATTGIRNIILERFEKTFEVVNEKDGVITDFYVVRNISDKPILEIATQPMMYSVPSDDNEADKLVLLEVNGEALPYSSEGLRYQRKTDIKWSAFDLKGERPDTRYLMTVKYRVPLNEPLKPGETINLKISLFVREVFWRVFSCESAGLTVREHTQKMKLVLKPQEGYSVVLRKRYGNESAPYGIVIDDILTDSRMEQEERDIEKPFYEADKLVWNVNKPVIGYRYIFPFVMIPKKAKPGHAKAAAMNKRRG